MTAKAPSAFSKKVPGLQLAWDATSLKALQFCPRYYQQTIIEGWVPITKSMDLTFGSLFASAVERYRKCRLAGQTKEQATIAATYLALQMSGKYVYDLPEAKKLREEDELPELFPSLKRWVPWGGVYVDQWRCSGTEKYRNDKGNAAKCPYAHKGVWQNVELPSTCGYCGSETVKENHWLPAGTKDRYALIRLVLAYCDAQPERVADGIFPYSFPDGTPAVELGWRMPTPWRTKKGERYVLAGYFDCLATYNREVFVDDNKSTTKALNASYWNRYLVDTQVDLYDISASVMYPKLNIRGVLIEAASFTPSSRGLDAKFSPQPFYRTPTIREETLKDIEKWLRLAEQYAIDKFWPMAKSQCWHCPFSKICSAEPKLRQGYLEGGDFEKRVWNPLEERT